MLPEMYSLIDPNAFHLNIAPHTSTPAYPNKFNPDGVAVPYTREEKSTINAKYAMVKNYFGMWQSMYTKHATTHLTSMFTIPLELHRQQLHQQQNGTRQCPFETYLTSSQQHTENQHLTPCARTTSHSRHRTTLKNHLKSFSKDAPASKRLQL